MKKKYICFLIVVLMVNALKAEIMRSSGGPDVITYSGGDCASTFNFDPKIISKSDLENILLYPGAPNTLNNPSPSDATAYFSKMESLKPLVPIQLIENYEYYYGRVKHFEWVKNQQKIFEQNKDLKILLSDSPDKKINMKTCQDGVKKEKNDHLAGNWFNCAVSQFRPTPSEVEKKFEKNWFKFFQSKKIKYTTSCTGGY